MGSSVYVPTVVMFLPTGDGYYLLCAPELIDILDIAQCIMALMHASDIKAYCVAHLGDVNVFTDMTGRENATGFDLGFARRIQEVSKEVGRLICSESLAAVWEDNKYFALQDALHSGTAKDSVEYRWLLADPIDFAAACAKFSS